MNWKKHKLGTHIAGADLKSRDLFREDILECFDCLTKCPIDAVGNFSEGVYYHPEIGCYAKFEGQWYTYKHINMFKFNQQLLEAAEIDTKDRQAIFAICKTKFATTEQHQLRYHLQFLADLRKADLRNYQFMKKYSPSKPKED